MTASEPDYVRRVVVDMHNRPYIKNVEPLQDRPVRSFAGGGGGSGEDGMEAWQSGVDRQLGEHRTAIEDLRKDHRELLRWFGGGFVTILGALAIGYLSLASMISSQSDKIDVKLEKLSDQVTDLRLAEVSRTAELKRIETPNDAKHKSQSKDDR